MLTLSLSVAAASSIKDVGYQDYMGKSDIQPSDNAGYKNIGFEDFMGKSDTQPSDNAGYKNIGFEDFMGQLGVDTSFDLRKIEAGKTVTGVVKDAEVLKKAGGPEGVKTGDTVIFHHLGEGKFRLSFPSLPSKNSLDIQMK